MLPLPLAQISDCSVLRSVAATTTHDFSRANSLLRKSWVLEEDDAQLSFQRLVSPVIIIVKFLIVIFLIVKLSIVNC